MERPPHGDASAPASAGQLTHADELAAIVEAFQPGVSHAVGYGSGVFGQRPAAGKEGEDREEESPMIDLLLAVPDPVAFHRQNLDRRPGHYSALCRLMGAGPVSALQRKAAAVHFHPLVDSPAAAHAAAAGGRRRRRIKYGVIHEADLLADLTEWRWLYAAGRMQKPTVAVPLGAEGAAAAALAEAQGRNLDMALAAALLLLPPPNPGGEGRGTWGLGTLHETIAGLSYGGDPRMALGGEDPDKVSKLARSEGQGGRFAALYGGALRRWEGEGMLSVDRTGGCGDVGGTVRLDLDHAPTRRRLWGTLPPGVRRGACSGFATAGESAAHLASVLAGIVGPAARAQSAKGLLTAGVARSARYAAAKFAKGALRGGM